MRKLMITVSALLTSFALFMTGISLLNTLIGIRGTSEGMSTTTIGIVASTYYFGLMIGSIRAQRLIATAGYIRSFAAFVAIISAMPLLHILMINEIIWCVLRFICGFCVAGQFVVVESWLNERACNQKRASLLSVYMMVTHLAVISGQFLLYAGSSDKFEVFAYATLLCVLSMVPLLLTKSAAPHIYEAPKVLQFTTLYKASPLAFIAVFVYGLNNAAFYGLSAIFVINIGLSESVIPIFINSAILGGLLFQMPIGKISDRIDRRIMIIILSSIAMIACFFVYLNTQDNLTLTRIIPFTLLFGATGFALYAVGCAHANDFATSDQRSQLAGALLMVFGFGSTLGPVMGTQVMLYFGYSALYLMMSVMYGLIVILAIYRMSQRKTVAIEDRTSIISINTATPSNIFIQNTLSESDDHKKASNK